MEKRIKNYRLIFTLRDYHFDGFLKLVDESERSIIKTDQNHSSIVFHWANNKMGKKDFNIKADGVITSDTNSIIRTIHADCLPIYFLDLENDIFALIHSGWKGTLNKIASHTLNDITRYYNLDPENIQVVIGPGIDYENYQVGNELFQKFKNKWNMELDFFKTDKEKDKYRLDLKEANKKLLIDSGVLPNNIFVSKLSTYESPELFHSYRRDGDSAGRMAAYIYKVRRNP